jgi:hypothetical protein
MPDVPLIGDDPRLASGRQGKGPGARRRLAKLLVIYEEPGPGRMTVVLVREPVGV